MNNNYLIWNKICKSPVRFMLLLIAVIETIILLFAPTTRQGLEFLYMLPFSFSICVVLWGKIFKYKGVGLKVYYIIAIIRYLVQPFLILLSNGQVSVIRMSQVKASSYYVSTVIQCIEIFIAFSIIRYTYGKMWIINKKKYANQSAIKNDIGITFWEK